MRILQLSDLHLFQNPTERLTGVPTSATFEAIWNVAKTYLDQSTVLVVTGDLCHDERPGTYQQFVDRLGSWAKQCLVLPGNHDDRASIRAWFPQSVDDFEPSIHFAREHDGWLLLGLDTQNTGEVAGHLESDQLHWLTKRLGQYGDLPCLLFMHHPPFLTGSEWLDRIGLLNADQFWEAIRPYANIEAVFCGHVHRDVHVRVNNIDCFATPSTAFQFDPDETIKYAHLPPGFRLIDAGDRLTTSVVRLEQLEHPPVPE